MLVTIDLPRIYLNTKVYKKSLILLMNRLVTFRIGSLNDLGYLLVLHYPTVYIQQNGFRLYRVQLRYHPLDFYLFKDLLRKIGEFVKRKLCYQLKYLHLCS